MMRQLVVFVTVGALLAACAPATETPEGCVPSTIQESESGFAEIEGEMQSDGEVWALLFFLTAHANEEAKIVWRITGEGDEFDAQAQSKAGTILQPLWKQYHESSSWERPGQEWGTGFVFPEPGCWTISVAYGETKGTISLDVEGAR